MLNDYFAELNTSFQNYMQNLRIQEAKHLIREKPEMSIKEISFNLGYSNPPAFTRAFRSVTSVSPTHYREHLLSNNSRDKSDAIDPIQGGLS